MTAETKVGNRASKFKTALPSLLRPLSIVAARWQGTGFPRLSEALRSYYQRHWSGDEVLVTDFQGDIRLALNLRDQMGSRIFWFDAYSRAELKLIGGLLSPDDVFIDVGANIGEFTLHAARLVGPNGKVIAIEPVPAIRSKLERHILWNAMGGSIIVVPDAIGNYEGTVAIFGPPPDAPEVHEGLPTLFASAERPVMIAEANQTTLDRLAVRLDLKKISGVKLDIEGAELHALRGGSEVLKHFRPWLICEIGAKTCEAAGYQPGEILSFLHGLGYSVFTIGAAQLTELRNANDLKPWQNVYASPCS